MRRADRELTDIEDFVEILDKCKTASIAMIDGNIPYVLPMNYGYEFVEDNLILYFHCAKEGRKLDILRENDRVCFTIFSEGEAVHSEIPCNSGYYFSSIIGNGKAQVIEDSVEKRYALAKMFAQQAGRMIEFTDIQASSVCVFKIVSKDYSGKRKDKPL